MSKKRPPITARMKVDCLLAAVISQFGEPLRCRLSNEPMMPSDNVQFDHTHALTHGGKHSYRDIRPVLYEPHKKKSKQDVRDAAHVKRLRKKRHARSQGAIAASRFPAQSKPLASSQFRVARP